MKVDSKTLYAGVPIVEVRDTLRRYRGSFFSVDFFARAMKISTTRAAGVRKQLLADGYLKATQNKHLKEELAEMTVKGNAFANATAAHLLHRETAELAVKQLLERVAKVNAPDCSFMYTVETVVLFGSLLSTDRKRVSDADVSFELVRKPELDFDRASNERVQAAREAGRQFRGFIEELCWPEREVKLFLKNRSRALSFVEWDLDWLRATPHKVIYRRPGLEPIEEVS